MQRPRWIAATVSLSLVGATMIGSPARAAPAPAFASSFEADDPQPDWTDTLERASGVDGNVTAGMPGSLRSHVAAITVNAQPNANENGNNLNDGDEATKWLVDTSPS